MTETKLELEDFLPHRGRMLLLHEILEMDENRAMTASIVTDRWPLCNGKAVNPIVLMEVIAQTAGVSCSLERVRTQGKDSKKEGWLVGIKKARFFIGDIPLETRIVTCTEKLFEFDGFREMQGTTRIAEKIICEASLQIFQPELE